MINYLSCIEGNGGGGLEDFHCIAQNAKLNVDISFEIVKRNLFDSDHWNLVNSQQRDL